MTPGYPPYPGYPGYPPRPPPPAAIAQYLARRSSIPRVVGILAIIFASIGLCSAVLWVFGPLDDLSRWNTTHQWSAVRSWLLVWGGLSVVVFVLHLVAGIFAVMYRPSAPRLVTWYAIAALLLAALDALLVATLAPSSGPHHMALWDSVSLPHLIHSALAAPWPIVAGLLMNTTGAKRACVLAAR